MSAFFISAGLIFIAELGDKSQLVALWFSTRYRWWVVVAGVTAATLVVHLGSVGIGRAINGLLPERLVLIVVGLSFFGFALWSLRGDRLDEDENTRRAGRFAAFGGFGVVTIAFFLSELGDKTQLATVSLAGDQSSVVGVWLGSTIGMVLADAAAIAVGLALGKRLPERRIAIAAAVLFILFGILSLVRGFTL